MKNFHITCTHHWIMDYGFERTDGTCIGLPCQYEMCMQSETGLYNIWVGVDFKKAQVHIYVEYECGGEVARETIDVSHVDAEEERSFMTVLDAIVDKYVEY